MLQSPEYSKHLLFESKLPLLGNHSTILSKVPVEQPPTSGSSSPTLVQQQSIPENSPDNNRGELVTSDQASISVASTTFLEDQGVTPSAILPTANSRTLSPISATIATLESSSPAQADYSIPILEDTLPLFFSLHYRY
ncbi:hypothetical protein AVEN_128258-1 [Araneus ventricosus]|uniref:Uncharacterized protein n=1 Tax=Araneus ventricosus TaxID=182803 RepID=A0A4Y2SRF5_ARAVE|nr:hypothetical protein AVEN_128258-1 [Araneus ventricosus]